MRGPQHARTTIVSITALLVAAAPVDGLEGRYQGTLSYLETNQEFQTTVHRFDVGGHKSYAQDLTASLNLSLNYSTRPGGRDLDLLQGRVFGEARGQRWRFHGQVVPWQETRPGPEAPRRRGLQGGFDWRTPIGPAVSLNYDRRDEHSAIGEAKSDDRRIAVTQNLRYLNYDLSWRRVDTVPTGSGATRATEEWKGAFGASRSWNAVAVRSAYDVLHSRTRSLERRRDFLAHRLNVAARWVIDPRWILGGSTQLREGRSKDNAAPADQDLSERAMHGQLDYVPIPSLTLRLIREYRDSEGGVAADYSRFVSLFHREMVRDVRLQAGFERNLEIFGSSGNTPRNSAFALVDGRVRRGLDGRIEVRTADTDLAGRQWRQLVQLRTDPVPESHWELTWRHDSIPRTGGTSQSDNEWNLVGGYRPTLAWDLVANLVWRDSGGVIATTERLASLRLAWSATERSNASFDWSRRRTTTELREATERVLRLNLTFWMPREVRVVGTGTHSTATGRPDARSLALTLEKVFR